MYSRCLFRWTVFLIVSVSSSLWIFAEARYSHHTPEWSYSAPQQWIEAYPSCAGYRQSPINIRVNNVESDAKMKKPLTLDYAEQRNRNTDVYEELENNGKTMIVHERAEETQKYKHRNMNVAGKEWNLIQWHFHAPSEHTVNGKHYDMEWHLVHQENGNSKNMAVLAIFMETKNDENDTWTEGMNGIEKMNDQHDAKMIKMDQDDGENEFLTYIGWEQLPEKKGEKYILPDDIDIADALPQNLSYWHYSGSLTTPPCSEVVEWFVLKTPIVISERQRREFVELIGHNNRQTQPLNDRSVSSVDEQSLAPSVMIERLPSLEYHIGWASGVILIIGILLFVLSVFYDTWKVRSVSFKTYFEQAKNWGSFGEFTRVPAISGASSISHNSPSTQTEDILSFDNSAQSSRGIV